jgi:hypothetical protein
MRNLRSSIVAAGVTAITLGSLVPAFAADSATHLKGHGHGTWQLKPSNPDTGTQRILRGHGHFSVGDAKVRGSVLAPGFVIEGSCHVSLRLVTNGGSIKVVGHSKVQSRSDGTICDGTDVRFRFHTTAGTGDLAGASYGGAGRVTLTDASADGDHGGFTLKLRDRIS